MAKGGNNQRSYGSRFSKPYDASNSFVKKVALRVSGYLGGLFGSTLKTDDTAATDQTTLRGTDNIVVTQSHYEATDSGKPMGIPRCYEDCGVNESSGKRIKIGAKRKFLPDLPISPIASTSSLFQSSINRNYDIQNGEDFITSVAGPSGLQTQKYAQNNSISTPTTTSNNDNIKANGATDNHSDSSESTSGCSSLVPQSDRLSQSAFVSNSRKKIIEEKLNYARQLKQNRASVYLNRSIPVVSDSSGNRRKPSFDISVYGSSIFDKSTVREKMVNSPFYTGQTSYGGASAYRRTRNAFNLQQGGRPTFERRDGVEIQVKSSRNVSTEDLSNMSHTAKRILEALEQFSTPISDAKRIPVNSRSPPLAKKRKYFGDSLDSSALLSGTKTALNQGKGPLISGLSVPTVPDLLKLKRLEKIQDSTAAARQVAVPKQEYSLPSDIPSKHTGKIVTKIKDKEKEIAFEKAPEVNLPKIPLPISTLPKFNFKLPPMATTNNDSTTSSKSVKTTNNGVVPSLKVSEPNKKFIFSPPITLSGPENVKVTSQKNNFTFSTPLEADSKREKSENAALWSLSNFMSAEAISKLKRKSKSEKSNFTFDFKHESDTPASALDILRKTLENNKKLENESAAEQSKNVNDTWECCSCLIRNLKDSSSCSGCKTPKISEPTNKNRKTDASPLISAPISEGAPAEVTSGFGNKFKPPSDSWSCKECFVNNKSTATKCIACENPKPQSNPAKEAVTETAVKLPVVTSGFGDVFKKKEGQWECAVCLIRNKENDVKCVACETPKPGAKIDKPEPPKFNFGVPASSGGFKFGIDKADAKDDTKASEIPKPIATQTNGPLTETAGKPSVVTSVGVFTYGIWSGGAQQKNEKESETKPETNKTAEPEKPQSIGFFGTAGKTEKPVFGSVSASPPESTSEPKEKESQPKIVEDVNDAKANDPLGTNTLAAKNNIMTKPFSFEDQNKQTLSPLFSFGSKDTGAKPPATTENTMTTTNTATFGSSFKMPENVPISNSGFTFGQSTSINNQIKPSSGSSDMSKSSFPEFSFSNKVESQSFNSNAPATDPAKNAEKITDVTTNAAAAAASTSTVTTTTNSLFQLSLFNYSKPKPIFGSSSNTNIPEFGAGIKTSTASDAANLNVTSTSTLFPSAAPLFNSALNVFNGPTGAAATNSFGSITSSTPFTASTTSGFTSNSDQGFRPTAAPFTSAVSGFTNPNTQMSSFGFFGSPANSFGASSNLGGNATSPPAFGFGQTTAAAKTPMAPFTLGDKNSSNSTTTSASTLPTTAPNVFTFGAPKPETTPSQFSSGFGQSNAPFTFGNHNTVQGSSFGNFSQTKTPSPFEKATTTFGSSAPPFGQSSAPATFGGTTPKFDFGASSRQTQSQPFQFRATTSQTQASSAPATTFSMSVPQTFNFTGGQTPVFSATPVAQTTQPRRVLKAIRRIQPR